MRVIVLTKSSKFKNYCVAGINIETGELVRLVSDDMETKGALTLDDITYENGTIMKVLDLIEVEIERPDNNPIQPENYVINREYYFSRIGEESIDEVITNFPCDNMPAIFGNDDYYVPESSIEEVGYSLALVHVSNLIISQNYNLEGKKKTKASFIYNAVQYDLMSVTDSCYYNIPDGTEYRDAILVLSIGTAYNSRYYKFVAAIYPLS